MYNQYNQQILDYEQKKKAAEALRQSGLDDVSVGRMIGEIYVARSPLKQIANVMKAYIGSRDAEAAQKNIDAARQEQAKALSDWQAAMPRRQAQDQPGPSAEDYMDWANKGMSISPEHANMAMKYADVNLSREARDRALQEKMLYEKQARQEKMIADQEAKQRQYEFMRESQKMNMENRADMARLSAALRPERMVTVMDASGNPVTVPQSQTSGMQIYNPTVAKQFQAEKAKATAREEMSGVIQQLLNSYDALRAGGGIVSKDAGVSNIGARVSQSGIGQFLGGAVGTKNQTERQKIEQTRPLLLNLIKNATGMSAQQMNSNAEMQLYLKAATDPTLSYEANKSALDNLERLYGLGINGGEWQIRPKE